MRIETHGQQLEVTPALRDYVESKLARLARHFEQPFDVRTQLSLNKPDHRAEANPFDMDAAEDAAQQDAEEQAQDGNAVEERPDRLDHRPAVRFAA